MISPLASSARAGLATRLTIEPLTLAEQRARRACSSFGCLCPRCRRAAYRLGDSGDRKSRPKAKRWRSSPALSPRPRASCLFTGLQITNMPSPPIGSKTNLGEEIAFSSSLTSRPGADRRFRRSDQGARIHSYNPTAAALTPFGSTIAQASFRCRSFRRIGAKTVSRPKA